MYRHRAFPLSWLALRMMCPNCGACNVWLTLEVPGALFRHSQRRRVGVGQFGRSWLICPAFGGKKILRKMLAGIFAVTLCKRGAMGSYHKVNRKNLALEEP